MKIALIGHGAMGQLVAKLATERHHEVSVTLDAPDAGRPAEDISAELSQCEVAIDFSVAAAVRRNVELCLLAGIPLVEGTTGWRIDHNELLRTVQETDGALIYGANFSVGAQLFFRIAGRPAELFKNLQSDDVFVKEAHDKGKAGGPWGTAIKLGDIVANHLGRDVPITSTRAGHIPGTHRVGFDSRADHITLEHVARSREGFAEGALMAAQW